MRVDRSEELIRRARSLIPGGVNSPVRAFGAVGGTPIFFKEASGATFVDEDGNRYIDYCGSWGPLILGHAPEPVVAAVTEAAREGLSFGAPSRREIELAELLVNAVEPVERVRFVSSGTEAVMSAIRLARGFTARDLIVKFEGCYHGHVDHLLVKGGSGLATFGTPSSAGIPGEIARRTLVLPLDDDGAVDEVFAGSGREIAALIIEPVPANAGLLVQRPEFLRHLREVTRSSGAILIFDEVISGFRVGPGGAAERAGVSPDLMTFGKVIGGGLPVAAFGGRREIMEKLAPLGAVYQAGTLSGNPVAMAAGAATLHEVLRPGFFDGLEKKGARLESGVNDIIRRLGLPVTFVRVGSIFWFAFQEPPAPRAFHGIRPGGMARYARFHRALLRQGVYFAPSGYEVGFISAAHTDAHLEQTIAAIENALTLAFEAAAGPEARARASAEAVTADGSEVTAGGGKP
jgi:glutamate-1-semialdehyde 2,1-aminomutase